MKKVVILVALVVLASLVIAGCTSSNTQSQNTQSGESNNSVSISATTVQSPQQIMSGSFPITPAAGNKFVMYNVTFTNINAQNRQVQSKMFTVQDASNNTYPMANFNQDLVTNHFPSAFTMTQPGTKLNGVIVYEVPQNVRLVNMTYDDHSANYGTYSHIVTKI